MDLFKQIKEQIISIYKQLTTAQKVSIFALFIIVLASLIFMIVKASSREEFSPLLYPSTPSSISSAVAQKLKKEGVKFRLVNGAIYVPTDERDKLIFDLYAEGLLPEGPDLYKWVFEQDLSETREKRNLKWQVTVKKRLERMITSISGVEGATVEFTQPSEIPYLLAEREQAKASVLLKLNPTARLSKNTILGIAKLVSFAIPNLEYANVSILDTSGKLYQIPREKAELDLDQEQLEQKIAYEKYYEDKVKALLSPIFSMVSVKASVTLESTSYYERKTGVDPDRVVKVSEDKEETKGTPSKPIEGKPGLVENLPQEVEKTTTPAGESTGTLEKSKRSIRNVAGEIESVLKKPAGNIKDATLAVVLPQEEIINYSPARNISVPAEKPVSQGEILEAGLRDIRELIAKSCNIPLDNVKVTPVSLIKPEIEIEKPLTGYDKLKRFIAMYLAEIILFVVVLISLLIIYRVTRPQVTKEEKEKITPEKERLEEVKLKLEPKKKTEEEILIEKVISFARDEPEKASRIIRQWMRKASENYPAKK